MNPSQHHSSLPEDGHPIDEIRDQLKGLKKEVKDAFWSDDAKIFLFLVALTATLAALYFTGTLRKSIPYLHYSWGVFQEIMEGPGDPLVSYDKAILLRPDWRRAYFSRAGLLSGRGNHEGAISDLNRVIKMNSADSEAFRKRGVEQLALGKYDWAIQDFSWAIQLDPKNGRAYHNRAEEYYRRRQYEAAIRDFDEALRLAPHITQAYSQRDQAKYDLKQEQPLRKGLEEPVQAP